MTWEVVIGLEIHAQLTTKTKIFSGSSIAYGAEPNTQANLLDLGMPGQLPVLNKAVIPKAIRLGLALSAEIGKRSVFDRKNYFYPDLPKGYQTSQFSYPIVDKGGFLDIEVDGETKRIGVTRAHLEEDAGKSIHDAFPGQTGVDLNRAGTPLLEIVSEPDMRSAQEAVAYAKKMHELVQYLGICDGNMQEGSFRVDSNVSIHKPGTPFGTRAELKNINSFKFIEQAIEYEIQRQIDILESGGQVVQETRLYDADKNETRSMREKEEANDYRYFPCPDLLPVVITDEDIEAIRADMPELPEAKRQRYVADFGLSDYDAAFLTGSRAMAEYFEAVLAETNEPKVSANWVMGELSKALNQNDMDIADSPVSAAQLAGLIARIQDQTISGKIAKQVFDAIWAGEGDADAIIEQKGLKQITDSSAIEAMVDDVLANNPSQVEAYKGGQEKMFGFFVGQVMKASQGQANPAQVNQILKEKLQS
ncbi:MULTISPECIES: Asp-tRNA(Asn)/Glu-tRNA(Gln) amidotransferase subunit GatB [Piscirickettsiaceae]|uniref:Aspartyl/glutamyl-tRNA(Asn/Gln) amidotransferase subunit B n=1 Tax=Hydrogenovibrio thermophilus TaxID=265883 RepID=A0A410H4B0_9GAMM|nr:MULTISPECIES: Asp-tRNA(Asn)/Glu-tRNA(Gln) amidotransferase subunit GatB [Piscirickettsiaceae]AZR81737.1 glutamyl-tRNA amidotransferase [Thiomicrospira sp. S5]QAB15741.1 Asp-tRNA(Asn)/Glu-tRNA(Gln) amidotransferase subunit GatB [Hydrogenovibrio thermophilus]